MARLRSPWWLIVALVVALAAWLFTIGPWGPWHWRTAGAERYVLHGRPGHFRTRIDDDVTLRGGRLRLRIAVVPLAPRSGVLPASFFADVRWWVGVPRTRTAAARTIAKGAEGLWGPHRTALVELDLIEGRPHGPARLGVRAAASSRAAVGVTLQETADIVRGFPVVGVIVFVWLVLFAVQSIRAVGHRPRPERVIAAGRHEA
jgi:hypothetical protein